MSNFQLTDTMDESCLIFRTNNDSAIGYNRTHTVALVQQDPDIIQIAFMNKVANISFIDDDSKYNSFSYLNTTRKIKLSNFTTPEKL